MDLYNNENTLCYKLRQIVQSAINHFNETEKYLMENDLSERCVCARFAYHLTNALENTPYKEYIVDVEYNRGADGTERAIKRIDNKPITVDMIVHKRGMDNNRGFDNLICIEMKKSNHPRKYAADKERLKKMTDSAYGFCYKLGFMIVIDKKQNLLIIEQEFQNGFAV